MNRIKSTYSAPEAELLVVRFEQAFLASVVQGASIIDADIDDWGDIN